jgi:hypothetical protein
MTKDQSNYDDGDRPNQLTGTLTIISHQPTHPPHQNREAQEKRIFIDASIRN